MKTLGQSKVKSLTRSYQVTIKLHNRDNEGTQGNTGIHIDITYGLITEC